MSSGCRLQGRLHGGDRDGDLKRVNTRRGDSRIDPTWSGLRILHVAILVSLVVGGVLFPLVGWLVAVALFWWAPGWTVRDKILGTTVLPGGLFAFVAVVGAHGPLGRSCLVSWMSPVHLACATSNPVALRIPVIPTAMLIGALLLLPIGCAAYLLGQLSAVQEPASSLWARRPSVPDEGYSRTTVVFNAPDPSDASQSGRFQQG